MAQAKTTRQRKLRQIAGVRDAQGNLLDRRRIQELIRLRASHITYEQIGTLELLLETYSLQLRQWGDYYRKCYENRCAVDLMSPEDRKAGRIPSDPVEPPPMILKHSDACRIREQIQSLAGIPTQAPASITPDDDDPIQGDFDEPAFRALQKALESDE